MRRLKILDLWRIKNPVNDPDSPWISIKERWPDKFDCYVKLDDGREVLAYFIEPSTMVSGNYFVSPEYPNDHIDNVVSWKYVQEGDY